MPPPFRKYYLPGSKVDFNVNILLEFTAAVAQTSPKSIQRVEIASKYDAKCQVRAGIKRLQTGFDSAF
jgi:hypothetical protein